MGMREEMGEDVLFVGIGNNEGNWLMREVRGNGGFSEDGWGWEWGVLGVNVMGEMVWRVEGRYERSRGVRRGRVVNGVNVSKDNECVDVDDGRNDRGELMVVGKDELGEGNGMILVEDGNEGVVEDEVDRIRVVEVMGGGREGLVCGE